MSVSDNQVMLVVMDSNKKGKQYVDGKLPDIMKYGTQFQNEVVTEEEVSKDDDNLEDIFDKEIRLVESSVNADETQDAGSGNVQNVDITEDSYTHDHYIRLSIVKKVDGVYNKYVQDAMPLSGSNNNLNNTTGLEGRLDRVFNDHTKSLRGKTSIRVRASAIRVVVYHNLDALINDSDIIVKSHTANGNTEHRTVSVIASAVSYDRGAAVKYWISDKDGNDLVSQTPMDLQFVVEGNQTYGDAKSFQRYMENNNGRVNHMSAGIPGLIKIMNEAVYRQDDGFIYVSYIEDGVTNTFKWGVRAPFLHMDIKVQLRVNYKFAYYTDNVYLANFEDSKLRSYANMVYIFNHVHELGLNARKYSSGWNKNQKEFCKCEGICGESHKIKYVEGIDPQADIGIIWCETRCDARAWVAVNDISYLPEFLRQATVQVGFYFNDFKMAAHAYKNIVLSGSSLSGLVTQERLATLSQQELGEIGMYWYMSVIRSGLSLRTPFMVMPTMKGKVDIPYAGKIGSGNEFEYYLSKISILPEIVNNTWKSVLGEDFLFSQNLIPKHSLMVMQFPKTDFDNTMSRRFMLFSVGLRASIDVSSLLLAITSNMIDYIDIVQTYVNGVYVTEENDRKLMDKSRDDYPEGDLMIKSAIIPSEEEVRAYIAYMKLHEPNYNLVSNNCHVMTKKLATYLTTGKLPIDTASNDFLALIGGTISTILKGGLTTLISGLL